MVMIVNIILQQILRYLNINLCVKTQSLEYVLKNKIFEL